MKNLLIILSGITLFLFGCKKAEPVSNIPINTVFIRVQNISSINYLNVRIDPINSGQTEDMGALLVGAISEYKGFRTVKKEFNTYIKISANLEKGFLYLISGGEPELSPGKYTLKIDYIRSNTNSNIYEPYIILNKD